jgi:hypothetical protein
MAQPIQVTISEAANGATFVPDNWFTEDQQSGDIIWVAVLNDAGNNPITIPLWTEIEGTAPNNSSRCSCWYIEHTGTDITAPTISGTSNDWIVFAILQRDTDVTDVINASARSDFPTDVFEYPAPSITTGEDDCLVYRIYGLDTGGVTSPSYCYGIENLARFDRSNNIGMYLDVETVGPSGLVPVATYNSGISGAGFDRDATTYTIAFNNKAGGNIMPSVNSQPLTIANYSEAPTVFDLSTIRSTLLGVSTAPLSINSTIRNTDYSADLAWYGGYTRYTVTPSASLAVQGLAKNITSTDMSANPYSVAFASQQTSLFSDDGPLFYFEDGAGSWVLWQPLTKDEFGNGRFRTLIARMPDQAFVDSSGVMDWSDIVVTGFAQEVVSTSVGQRRLDVSCECVVLPAKAIGGSADNPVTSGMIAESFNTGLGFYRSSSNGEGQDVIAASVEIGDFQTKTHFIGRADSLGYPVGGSDVLTGYNCGDYVFDFTVKASDACVIDFRSFIARAGNLQTITIDPLSSVLADYLTDGWIADGYSVNWISGVPCPNANFSRCGVLDIKGAEFIGGTVTGSVSATHAMTATDGAVIGYSFDKGAETYAIELPSVDGSYDLSRSSFSGYTIELNITAATGTTTINLSSGQAEPTYTTVGATVVFLTPVIEGLASITNMVVGSRLEIINETKGTKPYNDIVASSSFSDTYVDGTTYSNGDIITVRINYYSTITAKKEFSQSVIATSSGWSVLADQIDDLVYNSIGLDGGIITKFQADYINDEVDLVVGADFSGAEFYSWWVANGSTSQGVDEFFGGITAVDEANLRINNSIVDMYFDNTTTTNLKQADNRRIYREDGAYPVKNPTTGGGGIDVVWRNQVFVAGGNEIADNLLDRNLAGGSSGGRTVRDALRGSRNKVEINTKTNKMIVYKENDADIAWEADLQVGSRGAINTVDPS